VKTEADTRLQSVEGVNIDEELVALTTYQQAYNANARMITATKELFDTLENLIQ
jgi:flagellar hook-associated protein 1 FlgK